MLDFVFHGVYNNDIFYVRDKRIEPIHIPGLKRKLSQVAAEFQTGGSIMMTFFPQLESCKNNMKPLYFRHTV